MSESEIFADSMTESLGKGALEATLIEAGRLFSYYRVEHDGRYFFFKTFSEDTPFVRHLLRREYELSAGCDHPFIVHTFLYGEFLPGKEGILMEYVEGRTLEGFLSEDPPYDARRRVFGQLLEAVEYLHKKGIVHNDLKPSNILISRNGDTLRLIDLGLADDDAHFLLKTPGFSDVFAAPELKTSRISDVRSDVYSLGMIMKSLFGSKYAGIRKKSLHSSPEKRYKDVRELSRTWVRRNLPYRLSAGFLLLCLLAVGVLLLVSGNRSQQRRLHDVEGALKAQIETNRRQAEEVESLRVNYGEVQGVYQGLRDSLEGRRNMEEAHQKARDAVISPFKGELARRLREADKSLAACTTWREMNEISRDYNTALESYYLSYPKTADGEDLTAELTALYTASLKDFQSLLETHANRLP